VPSADLVAPDYTNRANYIGSGSIAALVGASKRMGPMDVYLSHVLPVAEEGEEAEWLRLGRLLQPVIAGEVCRRLNLNQSALDEYEVFDPARPHLRAHLDNFAYAISNGINNDDDNDGGRIIIESKATGPWAAEWTGLEEHECASSAFVQVTFQRALAERCEPGAWSKRMVVARFLNLGVRVYELEYDAELGELLLDAAHDFWVNHICAKVPPPLEGPSGSEYLKRRYPRANGHMRPADEGERLFVAAYRSARDEAKRAAEFAAGLRLKVEACIGDADGLEGLATWKASGESVAWKRVAEELARMTYEGQEGAETKAANLLRGTAFLHSKKKGRTLRLIGEKEDSE
jgi:predicted phage-related endonuclease